MTGAEAGASRAREGEGLRRVDWDTWTPRIVVGVVAILAIAFAFGDGGDFEVYWRSARRFFRGEALYPVSDGLGSYRYSPGILIFLAPFAALPLKAGLLSWYLLLVLVTGWVARVLPSQIQGPVASLAVLVGFLGVLRPFLDEFMYAQVNVLVLGLVVAAFLAEDRGREIQAGVLVALAVGLKLAPGILLVDMLLRRRGRALLGSAVGGLALLLAPVVTYGFPGMVAVNREWFHSLTSSATGLVGSQLNQGIFGQVALATQSMIHGPLPPGPPTWVAIGLAGALVGLALVAAGPYPRRAMVLFAMAAASPLGWLWNFVLAWPLMAWIASTGRASRLAVALLGIALLIPMYDVSGQAFEEQVFGAGLPGIALLSFFLLAWAIQRRRERAAARDASAPT